MLSTFANIMRLVDSAATRDVVGRLSDSTRDDTVLSSMVFARAHTHVAISIIVSQIKNDFLMFLVI